MSRKRLIIAIDGPAASGKSTTARLVAQRLGYLHLDTGAMYRAATLKVLRAGLDPGDTDRVVGIVSGSEISLREHNSRPIVLLDGEDVSDEIRSIRVSRAVSAVSSIRGVREVMVRQQRKIGAAGGVVLEGRDIGTVVFPDADLKFFMVASVKSRAMRRHAELATGSAEVELGNIEKELRERDRLDSERDLSPLRKAPDAIEIDTSDLTIDQQVGIIVAKALDMVEKGI